MVSVFTRAGSVLVQKTLFCTDLARTAALLSNALLAEGTECASHHCAPQQLQSLTEGRARYALVPYHKLECFNLMFSPGPLASIKLAEELFFLLDFIHKNGKTS